MKDIKTVCMLGLGYIGLPTAAMFATHGLKVIGVDINDAVVSTLNNGGIHIHEPGLQAIVQTALLSGNLCVVSRPEPADAFVIAVPTPFNPDKTADMRAVESAAESIVPYLKAGNLVVLESTSPPLSTVNLVQPILEKSGLKAGEDFFLAYSPERVLPGQILCELVENARVIGGINPASAEAGRDLYATFVKGEIVLTEATTAEMVKLMENTYRDVNIAIANEFSRLADRFGIDVWEAISIANRHPRVKILNPGPGVGGHCIGVDPWFLVEAAPDLTPLIKTARQVNDAQPQFVVDLVKRAVGELAGKKIAVLGLAYKPNVDDLRESPAVEVSASLIENGANVTTFEPYKLNYKLAGGQYAEHLDQALESAEAILILVKHKEFVELEPNDLLCKTSARIIIDAVNSLNRLNWELYGFKVFELGVNDFLPEKESFAQ